METALLFFLLFASKDPELRETLRNFLSFYRENRDLIAAMTNQAPMPESRPSEKPKETDSRPPEEVGDRALFEKYLSRLAERG